MSDPLADLMRALADGVRVDSASADALFLIAEDTERHGQAGLANAVRTVARMHRAKAITHQARLSALRLASAERHGSDPSAA